MTPEAMLREALPVGAVYPPEHFLALAESGDGTFWRGERSCIFLQRVSYERSGVTAMQAGPAGGDIAEILAAIPRLEAWARSLGCGRVLIGAGREGWRKPLKPLGYAVEQIVLGKALT